MVTYNFIDRTGQVFDRLTVIDRAPNKNGRTTWNCKCSCGNTTSVRGEHLKLGRIRSCGCHAIEVHTKHGLARTVEYKCWQGMKQRCYNKNVPQYKDYGERGITVCGRWQESFSNFIADMGKKPHKSLTIERVDNNKGYSPDNCVWATRSTQVHNRRNSILFTFNNETHCLKEWAKRLNMSYSTVSNRIKRGQSIGEALGID